MKHIKRGRAPSMMSGIAGLFAVGFGILWTVMASQAGGFFALFGVLWTCMAIAITIYSFMNATRKNRYSEYDITDSREEPDPLTKSFQQTDSQHDSHDSRGSRFCPYCGNTIEEGYRFCNTCGRELP